MNSFMIYIAQVSACLAVFYLVFWLFFRKLSFHGFNRGFLILALISSFIIPQLEVGFSYGIAKKFAFSEYEDLPFAEPIFSGNPIPEVETATAVPISELLLGVYLIGLIFCIGKFCHSIYKLVRLRKKSLTKVEGKFTIISINSVSPFSFFRWIFLPTDLYKAENATIISHEKAHGALWHSADLLLLELAKSFLWFNPVIYLIRKSLKSTHEFQADSRVLKHEIKTSDYLMLLLKNIEKQNPIGLHSYFQNSQLKQRIEMITNPKSRKTQLAKYLLVVPIAIFMVVIFSKGTRQIVEPSTLAFIGGQQFTGILTDYSKPSISPIEKGLYKKITSEYGMRVHPIYKTKQLHTGMDFSADFGVKIQSTADGVIVKVENSEKGYGKRIVIDHGNGILTSYSHLNNFNVKLGDKVKRRDIIGFVGSTGTSFAPHLHYEVIKDGKKVDPKDYMSDDDC